MLIILMLAFLIFAFLIFFASNYLIYLRLKKRDRDMNSLAKELNLSFQSDLPSFFALVSKLFVKDLELNQIKGTLNNHDVKVQDAYYGGLLNNFGTYMHRRTRLIVDGKQIPNLPPLGFNEIMFTSINNLRQYLKDLH